MTYTYPVEEYKKQLLAYYEMDRLSFKPEDSREFVIEKLEERCASKREISAVINTMIAEYVERFDFYDRVKGKSLFVIMSGEKALYANVVIRKGVI